MCYNKFNIISPAAAMQNEKTGIDARAQLLRQATAQIQAVTAQKAAACTQGLHTAAAAMAADVSCMLKMSGRESTQAEEEEVRMGFC